MMFSEACRQGIYSGKKLNKEMWGQIESSTLLVRWCNILKAPIKMDK